MSTPTNNNYFQPTWGDRAKSAGKHVLLGAGFAATSAASFVGAGFSFNAANTYKPDPITQLPWAACGGVPCPDNTVAVDKAIGGAAVGTGIALALASVGFFAKAVHDLVGRRQNAVNEQTPLNQVVVDPQPQSPTLR